MFDWAGALVIVGMSVAMFRWADRGGWKRALARLPSSRVAELAEGKQSKVTGVVEATATMPAPLTARDCVGWTVRAIGANAGAVGDRVLRSGACDFWLVDDEGGRVLVHGGRAQLVLTTSGGISAAREQGAVQRESIVAVGDRVTVVGMVRRELDPGGTSLYREAPTRLCLDGIPLWILPPV